MYLDIRPLHTYIVVYVCMHRDVRVSCRHFYGSGTWRSRKFPVTIQPTLFPTFSTDALPSASLSFLALLLSLLAVLESLLKKSKRQLRALACLFSKKIRPFWHSLLSLPLPLPVCTPQTAGDALGLSQWSVRCRVYVHLRNRSEMKCVSSFSLQWTQLRTDEERDMYIAALTNLS